jgi:hypothetical protein
MKITETQIRQVIKEEIQNVLNETHDEDPTSLGLTGPKVAAGVAGAVGVNGLIKYLEQTLMEHPEWRDQVEKFLMAGNETINSVGNTIGSMFENKKRK